MQTGDGFDLKHLLGEAQKRWLKPVEVLFILQNHESHQITQRAPQKPTSGSLYLFNKRVLRFFRKDGHNWRKKRDGRSVGEAHERLKVGNAEALNCYYAHGEDYPSFQRRSYWMLDPAYEHIVLVHYRDVSEGSPSSASISEFSSGKSFTFSQNTTSYARHNQVSASLSNLHESPQSISSPASVEVSSGAFYQNKDVHHDVGLVERGNIGTSSVADVSQALRRIEEQLSLDDDSFNKYVCFENQDQVIGSSTVLSYDNGLSKLHDDVALQSGQYFNVRSGIVSSNDSSSWQDTGSVLMNEEADEFNIPTCSSGLTMRGANLDYYSTLLDQGHIQGDISSMGPLEADSSLAVANEQKFTIREVSPSWSFAGQATKVIIVGSFCCSNPSELPWSCMFGHIEVPAYIIQDGVLCCQSPPHGPGKVSLCITSGNRQSCSEIREFEYHSDTMPCLKCGGCPSQPARSTDELLILARFAQMLLCESSRYRTQANELMANLSNNLKSDEDSWDLIIGELLAGDGTQSAPADWILQELLKDKLQQWLSMKSHSEAYNTSGCYLSKKEQGIIHMIAALGYEWALNPVLGAGVGINFRDINGWTALHWAARFGREKMVAALIASGALAGAVTDPNKQDPTGKTPATIAASNGHKGLAGYLSELAVTSHLSALTLQETEFSKESASVEAEVTLTDASNAAVASGQDPTALKQTLAAVRNAAQAAARIQAAFRAHSFRRRQHKDAEVDSEASALDEYGFSPLEIQGLSAASKLVFRHLKDHDIAAMAIQKNYRGWKGRRDFLTLRQKVVKIQAHVRGYQVRKKYKVFCWVVGIYEKAVLRWRRRGAGLRGYKPETSEPVDESEDYEDILKVFRKQKVDGTLHEAVARVKSMVKSPEARQQYARMVEKLEEAKVMGVQNVSIPLLQAELRMVTNEAGTSSSQADDGFIMDDDDIFQYLVDPTDNVPHLG